MYESFYGLKEKPFSIQPDPDFLFLSKRHEMAYTMLEFAIENRAAFSVIAGDIGCGKTTIVRHLLNNIDQSIKIGMVTNTHPDFGDILEWVMLAYGLSHEGLSKVALFDQFQQFLIKEYAEGNRIVLIIDEAQNLTAPGLEALRLLSNINADKHQLLQTILIGQPELQDLLRKPELTQFAQRVAVDFRLMPLEGEEVEEYIKHRLLVAGRWQPLFTSKACKVIAEAAKGVPRSINIICEMALVYGMAQEADPIDDNVVQSVLSDRADYGALNLMA